MEGLISQGHFGTKAMANRDDSSSPEPRAVSRPTTGSATHESASSKSKKKTSSVPGTPDDRPGGSSHPQTWKDKPGMAKKRKRANVRPGWEIIEVDDDDEDVISSGRDVVLGPRPSTSGLKGKTNGEDPSRRSVIYDIDSSSHGGSSSESAHETDEEDYEQFKSQSSRGKNGKKKSKQVEKAKSSPAPKQKQKQKQKQKEKEKGKSKGAKHNKERALSQDPEIQEIALSGMNNSVFVIGMSFTLEW
jgi:hypothetical protein